MYNDNNHLLNKIKNKKVKAQINKLNKIIQNKKEEKNINKFGI